MNSWSSCRSLSSAGTLGGHHLAPLTPFILIPALLSLSREEHGSEAIAALPPRRRKWMGELPWSTNTTSSLVLSLPLPLGKVKKQTLSQQEIQNFTLDPPSLVEEILPLGMQWDIHGATQSTSHTLWRRVHDGSSWSFEQMLLILSCYRLCCQCPPESVGVLSFKAFSVSGMTMRPVGCF
jgi:hypothetical protein